MVGRVNKGKSSVIATLAEDERIAVSPLPGTTTEASVFPVVVDGRTLFTLIDTPGFEQAAQALAWLEQTPVGSEQRSVRVRAFVERSVAAGEFADECKLLAPILAGAGILYVVDGEKPYRDNYRAEMEILRWTGQPSMALINRIGAGDHAEDWRRALNQYFKWCATDAQRRPSKSIVAHHPAELPDLPRAGASAIEAGSGRRPAQVELLKGLRAADGAVTFTSRRAARTA